MTPGTSAEDISNVQFLLAVTELECYEKFATPCVRIKHCEIINGIIRGLTYDQISIAPSPVLLAA